MEVDSQFRLDILQVLRGSGRIIFRLLHLNANEVRCIKERNFEMESFTQRLHLNTMETTINNSALTRWNCNIAPKEYTNQQDESKYSAYYACYQSRSHLIYLLCLL